MHIAHTGKGLRRRHCRQANESKTGGLVTTRMAPRHDILGNECASSSFFCEDYDYHCKSCPTDLVSIYSSQHAREVRRSEANAENTASQLTGSGSVPIPSSLALSASLSLSLFSTNALVHFSETFALRNGEDSPLQQHYTVVLVRHRVGIELSTRLGSALHWRTSSLLASRTYLLSHAIPSRPRSSRRGE